MLSINFVIRVAVSGERSLIVISRRHPKYLNVFWKLLIEEGMRVTSLQINNHLTIESLFMHQF